MKSTIVPSPVSIEIRPLSYSKDDLIAGCNFIGVAPSPPNMRRIRRAMNIFNAGAVHFTSSNGDQCYMVQSESDNNRFYLVQGLDMRSLTCECPDHLNGWECKHIFAVRYFDEQRREQAMIADYEAQAAEYEANRWCAEDLEEGRRAAHLAEPRATYARELHTQGCVTKLNDHLYNVRDPRVENRIGEPYTVGVNTKFDPPCLCSWADRDWQCSHEMAVELYEAAQ